MKLTSTRYFLSSFVSFPFFVFVLKVRILIIRRKRKVRKKVVSIPSKEVESRFKESEISFPPSDSWTWRKYGQKPIKGSPYPRGYYKCSSSKGCPARKQVERSRVDPTTLVVTYSSDHNHPSPPPPPSRSKPAAAAAIHPDTPDRGGGCGDVVVGCVYAHEGRGRVVVCGSGRVAGVYGGVQAPPWDGNGGEDLLTGLRRV
ncbi:Probable WRKY transcription factor 69 [Linum grandiflorum]